jgi:hypothetical protein
VLDLTLDLQVFMSGAGTGDEANRSESRQLMLVMRDLDRACLVVDDQGHLMREYDRRSGQAFGKQWMIAMLSRRSVKRVTRVTLNRATRVALDDQKFRGEDRDWIARTAAASDSGLLVAHEDHFHAKKVKKILKKDLDVEVITATEATAALRQAK